MSGTRPDVLRVLRPAAGVAVAEVVIFPHAGAYAGTYHSLAARLPSTVGVRVVTARAAGAQPAEIAGALAEHSGLPRMFAGHSLGGLLAWHVTAALTGAALPEVLVLSAALPPDATRERLRRVAGLDGAQLERHLRDTGALDGAATGDGRLREYYVKAYRDDVRLALGWLPAGQPRLGVPLLTLCGTDDLVTSCAEVRHWEQHTAGPVEHACVPGAHDFFYTSPQVTTVLSRALAGARRAGP